MAYTLWPWLLTPYDNAKYETVEDTYNYYHSSYRIYVKCAFGEIYSCWGILWSPLWFSLKYNLIIIDSAMRLHNFIVKYEIKYNKRSKLNLEFDRDVLNHMCANTNSTFGVFGDNERPSRYGHSFNIDACLKLVGEQVCNKIRDKVGRVGISRPRSN